MQIKLIIRNQQLARPAAITVTHKYSMLLFCLVWLKRTSGFGFKTTAKL